MDKQKYLEKYFTDLRNVMNFDEEKIQNLITVSEILVNANNSGKKTLIFGNGGSAAIASHFGVDITKNARVRCVNYNESDLLTCFQMILVMKNGLKNAIEYYRYR